MSDDPPEIIDQRLIRALAHPLRIRILDLLSDRVASPNVLAGELESELSDVAYHTRALDRLGCVDLVHTAPRRGAVEHFYKAVPDSFIGDRTWRKVPQPIRGGVSAATLQTFLDKAVDALEAGTLDARDDTIFRWMPLQLDRKGWREVVAVFEQATNLILAAHLRSQDRLSASGGRDGISTVVGMASFETASSVER